MAYACVMPGLLPTAKGAVLPKTFFLMACLCHARARGNGEECCAAQNVLWRGDCLEKIELHLILYREKYKALSEVSIV